MSEMEKEIFYNKPWILQRADPYIYRHTDGTYYFTASVPEYDKIILRRADTLAGLRTAQEKEVWHKHETGVMSSHSVPFRWRQPYSKAKADTIMCGRRKQAWEDRFPICILRKWSRLTG